MTPAEPVQPPTGPRKVSVRRVESALATLGDLTTEEHAELTGQVRDAIGLVRNALWDIAERRKGTSRG